MQFVRWHSVASWSVCVHVHVTHCFLFSTSSHFNVYNYKMQMRIWKNQLQNECKYKKVVPTPPFCTKRPLAGILYCSPSPPLYVAKIWRRMKMAISSRYTHEKWWFSIRVDRLRKNKQQEWEWGRQKNIKKCHAVYAPCMEYLPTCTHKWPKRIPYVERMGVCVCLIRQMELTWNEDRNENGIMSHDVLMSKQSWYNLRATRRCSKNGMIRWDPVFGRRISNLKVYIFFLKKTEVGLWKKQFHGRYLRFRSTIIQTSGISSHQSAPGNRPSWMLQDRWLKCRVPAQWSANDLPSTSEWRERCAARWDSPVPLDPCLTIQ